MTRRARKHQVNHERWLVSYADFITLLFAFFVVLYSASKADQKKQAQVSASINSAFSALGIFADTRHHSGGANPKIQATDQPVIPMNIVMGEDVLAPAQVRQDLERIRGELQQTLSNQIAQHTVSIQMGREGLVISLREAGFFNSGSATPHPDTLDTLRQVAAALSLTPYNLRIEGHTDNIPIHTDEFDSNWELSTARATRIARLLLDLKSVPPDRLSAAGYAEFHPVASNATPDGRAENRRVDLVVMPRSKIDLNATLPASGITHRPGAWRKIIDDN
ncbi:MAG: flagellar motor protein MotB [Terracidiphilus sp.]|jgi:chemotaxis protein MotB